MALVEFHYNAGRMAGERGDSELARSHFERGIAAGEEWCLFALGHMYDVGNGVEVDKARAMAFYQRAWRRERCATSANNIAILYRERGDYRAMAGWWKRLAALGDPTGHVQLADCYKKGLGVRQSLEQMMRHVAVVMADIDVHPGDREEIEAILADFRPHIVS